jgi:hypothetical protein
MLKNEKRFIFETPTHSTRSSKWNYFYRTTKRKRSK